MIKILRVAFWDSENMKQEQAVIYDFDYFCRSIKEIILYGLKEEEYESNPSKKERKEKQTSN